MTETTKTTKEAWPEERLAGLLAATLPLYTLLCNTQCSGEVNQLLTVLQVALEEAQGQEPGSMAREQAATIRRRQLEREEDIERRCREHNSADETQADLLGLLEMFPSVTLTRSYHDEDELWSVDVVWDDPETGPWSASNRHRALAGAVENALCEAVKANQGSDQDWGVQMADGSYRHL